jgi:hypothetical protein
MINTLCSIHKSDMDRLFSNNILLKLKTNADDLTLSLCGHQPRYCLRQKAGEQLLDCSGALLAMQVSQWWWGKTDSSCWIRICIPEMLKNGLVATTATGSAFCGSPSPIVQSWGSLSFARTIHLLSLPRDRPPPRRHLLWLSLYSSSSSFPTSTGRLRLLAAAAATGPCTATDELRCPAPPSICCQPIPGVDLGGPRRGCAEHRSARARRSELASDLAEARFLPRVRSSARHHPCHVCRPPLEVQAYCGGLAVGS